MPSKKRNIHIIPDRLRLVMDFKGKKKSIRQLSNDTGLSEKTIYTARTSGNVSPETLNTLCESLNTSPSYLLGEDKKKMTDKNLILEYANEFEAMAQDSQMKELHDREAYVRNIGKVLKQSRIGIKDMYLSNRGNTVHIIYDDDTEITVNVDADSYSGIFKDIARKI